MLRQCGWVLIASAIALAPAQPAAAQPQRGHGGESHRPGDQPPPRKWWTDPQDRAELGINDQQSALVETIWQKSLPQLRDTRERLDKLEDALSQLIRDGADEAIVIPEIDRVERVRAEHNKARTLMLYRMNKVLTADQRVRLKALWDRQHDPSRRGSGPR
jgi:Spy/CpxP family protein refolding chaperone